MTIDKFKKRWVLVTALVILSVVVTGFVWAHKKVQIVVDGKQLDIRTLHSKPEDVLVQAGIAMGDRDEYRLSTAKLTNGSVIAVYRAVPVKVTYQGKTEMVVTAKPTVGEAAQALGITQPNVKLVPAENTSVTADMHIKAVVVNENVIEKEIPVLYPVVRQPDPTMEKGDERVVESGVDGRKIAKIKLTFEDGVQTASETLSEKTLEEPKPQVVHVGVRDTVETSRGTLRFKRVEWMEATAYLPTDGDGHGITATGIAARHGIVAVDPRYLPLGSRLYIPGYGLALAADTGSAIIGDKIDLCMEDAGDAWYFGRRGIKVYVLE